MIGAPDIVPCSLAKAMTEPEKVMAPMATPSPISMIDAILMLPATPMPKASGDMKAAQATSTAARPTSEWNAATSCGIAVMAMRLAMMAPMPPPMITPTAMKVHTVGSVMSWRMRVVPTAIAIPTMPKRLPWRDVSGLESPRSAMMKSTPDAR